MKTINYTDAGDDKLFFYESENGNIVIGAEAVAWETNPHAHAKIEISKEELKSLIKDLSDLL
jgi:hypothetical protein